MMRRLIEMLAGWLDSAEREAVLGDLVESGNSEVASLCDLVGLVARRQTAPCRTARPWLALTGLPNATG